MLYVFACKFLKEEELAKVKEEIGMTILGKMLMDDGIEKGIEKGIIALVNTYKRFNATKAEAVVAVEKAFSLTQEKAESCVEKYWSE